MNTSVSTRTSATVPLVSAGHGGVWGGAVGRRERVGGVGSDLGEVVVESSSDDLGHGDALGVGERVDAFALLIGQVHLGTGRGHTAQYTALVAALALRPIRAPRRLGVRPIGRVREALPSTRRGCSRSLAGQFRVVGDRDVELGYGPSWLR